ncbi:trimethylamine methyltransferase family protein [Hwanghaeella sp.]|uniref:trimethylamine methyltransferase family protein n=1 Tax=Hwanghaeella sp. TaxID=2605943 RepID=UPI003CCBE1FA
MTSFEKYVMDLDHIGALHRTMQGLSFDDNQMAQDGKRKRQARAVFRGKAKGGNAGPLVLMPDDRRNAYGFCRRPARKVTPAGPDFSLCRQPAGSLNSSPVP